MLQARRIPVVTGPTAVGKTSIAVDVATRLGLEIVSADSRQVYREFGVAVDKPTAADRERAVHHLVDSHSVSEPLSAGAFARHAEATIRSILADGGRPLVSGGSTLYLHALVHGLADIPSVAPEIRLALRRRLEREGPQALFEELARVDPEFASTLDSTKSQRVLRGLEVHEATGRPLSSYFDAAVAPAFDYDIIVLTRDRQDLYRRIDARVSDMVASGLVQETQRLMDGGFDPDANPTRTIGYPEAAAHLRGEIDREEMIRRIRRNTRRYAKRQLTWLRRFDDALWIDLSTDERATVVDRLADRFSA